MSLRSRRREARAFDERMVRRRELPRTVGCALRARCTVRSVAREKLSARTRGSGSSMIVSRRPNHCRMLFTMLRSLTRWAAAITPTRPSCARHRCESLRSPGHSVKVVSADKSAATAHLGRIELVSNGTRTGCVIGGIPV